MSSPVLPDKIGFESFQNIFCLHLSVMQKKSCNISEALEELHEMITKFTPQGPRMHSFEGAKVEYLYDAIMSTDWPQRALAQCYTNQPS